MRWLPIVVAVLGLALVGAGCGGGDDEASDDSGITITETTDTETLDTTDDTDTDTEAIGDLSEDCLAAVGAFSALGQAVAAAGTGTDTDAEESAERLEEFADEAPDEIEDDIRVLAAAYAEYIDELSGLGLEDGETPSADQIQQLTAAAQKLSTPEIQAASESFTTWANANCPG